MRTCVRLKVKVKTNLDSRKTQTGAVQDGSKIRKPLDSRKNQTGAIQDDSKTRKPKKQTTTKTKRKQSCLRKHRVRNLNHFLQEEGKNRVSQTTSVSKVELGYIKHTNKIKQRVQLISYQKYFGPIYKRVVTQKFRVVLRECINTSYL